MNTIIGLKINRFRLFTKKTSLSFRKWGACVINGAHHCFLARKRWHRECPVVSSSIIKTSLVLKDCLCHKVLFLICPIRCSFAIKFSIFLLKKKNVYISLIEHEAFGHKIKIFWLSNWSKPDLDTLFCGPAIINSFFFLSH